MSFEPQKSAFAFIPAHILYNKNLTDGDKILYGHISNLANQYGYCWASNNYLTLLTTKSLATIKRSIKQLRDSGFIRIEHEENGDNDKRKIFLTSIEFLKEGGSSNMSHPRLTDELGGSSNMSHIIYKEERTNLKEQQPREQKPKKVVVVSHKEKMLEEYNLKAKEREEKRKRVEAFKAEAAEAARKAAFASHKPIFISEKVEILLKSFKGMNEGILRKLVTKYSEQDIEEACLYVAQMSPDNPIAYLQTALKNKFKPFIPKQKMTHRQWVEQRFRNGHVYNGAECFINDESVAFQRGDTHKQVKYRENGFKDQFESMIHRFGI